MPGDTIMSPDAITAIARKTASFVAERDYLAANTEIKRFFTLIIRDSMVTDVEVIHEVMKHDWAHMMSTMKKEALFLEHARDDAVNMLEGDSFTSSGNRDAAVAKCVELLGVMFDGETIDLVFSGTVDFLEKTHPYIGLKETMAAAFELVLRGVHRHAFYRLFRETATSIKYRTSMGSRMGSPSKNTPLVAVSSTGHIAVARLLLSD
jgi:hypothetical protein